MGGICFNITYMYSLYPLQEFVVSVEDELGSEFPFFRFSLLEVIFNLQAMFLVSLLEGSQSFQGFGNFLNRFLDLSFKDLQRLQISGSLKINTLYIIKLSILLVSGYRNKNTLNLQ